MEEHLCAGCMRVTDEEVCPFCGWVEGQENKPHQLQPGTFLQGKYAVGRVLGQGGFGITYIGWDYEMERIVAIKEFYPGSTVNRDTCSTNYVSVNTVDDGNRYTSSRERFLREARALVKLSGVPEIVSVYSCFEENNTAYIVMEYVNGQTLVDYVRQQGGKLTVQQTLKILEPIMRTLDTVHKAGLVHRDISPDNIMLHSDGWVKLLDFGAVRAVENPDAQKELTHSTEAIVKHGFAPMEQYYSRGSIGPWTDEYALCATVYFCLTGTVPPGAPARFAGDEQPDWAGIPGLTNGQRAALEKGMALMAKDRYPSVGALAQALSAPEPEKRPGRGKWIAVAAGITAVIAVGIGMALLLAGQGDKPLPETAPAEQAMASSHPTAAPTAETQAPEIVPSAQEVPEMTQLAAPEPVRETFVMIASDDLMGTPFNVREARPIWGQWEYLRNQVNTIRFHDTMEGAPENAWDVSEAKDGSILAWMDGANLHVAANGNIAANPNASYLFSGFSNLATIDFGGCFVTTGVTNMWGMFEYCFELRTLDLSGFDTSAVKYMDDMFADCFALKSLNLSSFDTSKVRSMFSMFSRCMELRSLDLSSFDTSNVENMCQMFCECMNLTELDVSGFNTSEVRWMDTMFAECFALMSLNLSSFDTANVTSMAYMFSNCCNLTELDLSNFDTANVTDMSSMFYGCSNLVSLNLSGFDSASLTSLGWMFKGCSKLEQLNCMDSKILKEYPNR